MLEILLLFLLLPVAAATGWYAAQRARNRPAADGGISADYLKGLNYLVNEDADKAIQVFVRLLEVDNETVEIHLALGNLFRRQGEVDRALRIHQNLVARPNLSPEHRQQARYELAQDYLRAGMLDRAEDLLRELVLQGTFREHGLAGLITIYEQERDWHKAIEATRQLEAVRGHSLRPVIAQYLCELAEESRRKRDLRSAGEYLQRAQGEYRECVRASLLQGELEEAQGNHEAAARSYRQVPMQDREYLGEIIEPLERCYERLGRADAWQQFLEELTATHDSVQGSVAMARLFARNGRREEAVSYLSRHLQKTPSWLGFYHLLELAEGGDARAGVDASMRPLKQALRQMIQSSPRYQCSHCGFSGRTLYWQCPGCRQWNSVTPLRDIMSRDT